MLAENDIYAITQILDDDFCVNWCLWLIFNDGLSMQLSLYVATTIKKKKKIYIFLACLTVDLYPVCYLASQFSALVNIIANINNNTTELQA